MATTHETWESLSETLSGIVSPDPDRKASQVLTNCIMTIFERTILCVHLNLPTQYKQHGTAPRWKECWPLLRQLKWGVAIIVAPEMLVSFALGEWRLQRISHHIAESWQRGACVGGRAPMLTLQTWAHCFEAQKRWRRASLLALSGNVIFPDTPGIHLCQARIVLVVKSLKRSHVTLSLYKPALPILSNNNFNLSPGCREPTLMRCHCSSSFSSL